MPPLASFIGKCALIPVEKCMLLAGASALEQACPGTGALA